MRSRGLRPAAEKVIDDAFSNAQISAVCQYYKRIKGQNMSKEKGASQIYLTEQQYLQVSIDWIVKDVEAWRWLAKKWSTPEWIASSKLHRENRGNALGHRFGADGHYNLAKRMEHEAGVAPGFMDVYVRGHRGPDPTNPEVLCTEAAREKMMAYGVEMTQRHGPDFDWRHSEVDAKALHASSGGRRHCKYAFGIGVVDYDQSVSLARRSGYHNSYGTRRELATLLPSSNVSAAGVDKVSATTPGRTSGMDDGTPSLPSTSGVDDGTLGLPDTSDVDSTAGIGAISGVDATYVLDGTARLPTTFRVDDTPGLNATFGVDAGCCTTLQPMDAITSSTVWITGFGLTPSWANSRCGRER
ncbi:hypothetical protein U9M48_024217 [Paspalum notatum var. saurae]|uniref:Uncharacterized protein n=1 Tax=Paspalum notatum var. saurae TaxID=547442 RepID=A0AAQ3WVF0_PASNO